MKKLFYSGALLLTLFELANVYFIMPMPFSQQMRSIDVAYALHSFRWLFRAVFGVMILAGVSAIWYAPGWRKAMVPVSLLLAGTVVWAANYKMAAEVMFLQPTTLIMQPAARNAVEAARLVVGVEINGEARAYPIRFIGYHHQVRDTVGGQPVMVSYCTVCRTGRVFSPVVEGRPETFRLVGMDHFNAMFEDKTTGSWWRQANGEAVIGPAKGKWLAELRSQQVTLAQWLELHPASLIMQADPTLQEKYARGFDFESGASRATLTGTDTMSWHEKSWVVGITVNRASKAYDWNRLRRERVVNDELGGKAIVLVLAADQKSYFAFERPDSAIRFIIRGDSLVAGSRSYTLGGLGASGTLKPLNASQEFWHSWRTFHPGTQRY